MTKLIEASEITTNHVLVDANGRVAFVSLVSRGKTHTVIRANGQMAAVRNTRKLRVKA